MTRQNIGFLIRKKEEIVSGKKCLLSRPPVIRPKWCLIGFFVWIEKSVTCISARFNQIHCCRGWFQAFPHEIYFIWINDKIISHNDITTGGKSDKVVFFG